MFRSVLVAGLALGILTASASAQTREEKVRADRAKVEAEGFWIYNDLERGFAEARKTGKPLLVVLRCIPCEECVKLDEDLMEQDPHLKPLLDRFVRVRLIATNGLDLSLFQFDYDQSFAVFLLNADKTIYGRFGTRSHRTFWAKDVSIEGLAEAMRGALELHAEYPANRVALTGKRGPQPLFPVPEKSPLHTGKYSAKLNYEGNVVQSCIHCHQVGDAQRDVFRRQGRPIPENVLFQYPHPKSIGLILDPTKRAVVTEVADDSPAARSGFRPGDAIRTLAGQPLLSIADVQWVLHHAADEAALTAEVVRDGNLVQVTLSLPSGWRRQDDVSWRATTWPLRRMATGGMVLELLSVAQRAAAGIEGEADMALRIKGLGRYGAHATARKAGFREGDVLIEFDGRSDLQREADLLTYAVNFRKSGERVRVAVLRNGKRLELTLPMQD